MLGGLGLFKTIVIDPPWPEYGGGKIKRGADRHYNLMSVEEIKALPVMSIADRNAHLYLWATNNYLPAALACMAGWGFRYRTTITWVKDRIGLGQYFRGITEHCLFGIRGMLPYRVIDGKRGQGQTVIVAARGAHSSKPGALQEMAERVSWPPRIELFARRPREGWKVWGNEI
jgi:N6-adenosine-specific RNA methylase IME4